MGRLCAALVRPCLQELLHDTVSRSQDMVGGLIVDKTEEIIRHAQQFARRPKDSPAGYRSHLTKEERDILLAEKDTQFLKNLCCYLADRIQELGDILEEQSRQLLMDDLAIGRTAGEENGWIPAEDVRQHFTERI